MKTIVFRYDLNKSPKSSVESGIFPDQKTTLFQVAPLFPTHVCFKVFTGTSQRKCNCFSLGWLAGTTGNQKVWHAVDVLQEPAGGVQEIDSRSTCRLRHLSQTRLIGPRQVPEPHWVTESEDLRRNRSVLTLFRSQSALCCFIAPHKKAAW